MVSVSTGIPATYQDPAVPLIALPTTFTSRRLNTDVSIPEGGSAEVASIDGPGCIRHIWFLRGEGLQLEIICDDEKRVLAPLPSFFGVMQEREPYFVDCAAYTVLPNPVAMAKDPLIPGNPGYNLYLPIPFARSCTIRVHGLQGEPLGAMIDWHEYDGDTPLTPYRFHTAYKRYKTPPRRGLIDMADVSGSGFIAGFVTGYIQKNHEDMVFHTWGTTILLDGETRPNAIRGCNVEDDYGFTWGFNDYQTRWIGCPQHDNRGRNDQDGVLYRFFGPDPVAFHSSMSFRAGCRGDDLETVVYYYKIDGSDAPDVELPTEWQIVGLFEGASDFATFTRAEFVENLQEEEWPSVLEHSGETLEVSVLAAHRGWIDLQEVFYRVSGRSAYARTTIKSEKERAATLRISVDDWCNVWINGSRIATLRHEKGLETARIPVKLLQGDNNLVLKTNNLEATPNRLLWAINCAIE